MTPRQTKSDVVGKADIGRRLLAVQPELVHLLHERRQDAAWISRARAVVAYVEGGR